MTGTKSTGTTAPWTRPAPWPQEVAKVTANIDYLSMMTGVDLPDAEEKEETVNG